MMEQEDRVRELVAAYVLGTTSPDEESLVERHLPACAACRREERELREVERVLPLLAGELAPPPALKGRLMSAVEADVRLRAGAGRPKLIAVPSGQAAMVPRDTAPSSSPRWIVRAPTFYAVLAAAAVCALVALGAGIWQAVGGAPQPTRTTEMAAALPHSSIHGQLAYYKGDNKLVLTLHGLKPTPSGHVYELWLVRAQGGKITAVKGLDVFRSTDGNGRLVVYNHDLHGYNMTGLTLERHFSPDKPTPPIYAEGLNPAA